MKLPFHIVELLKCKSGSDLRLPSQCELLSLDIESRTGVRIGATTLKRLLGLTADERTPHTSTLDAIARYLGYKHWDELSQVEAVGNSDFEAPDGELRSADLREGCMVEIGWLPDRRLVLRYLGNNHYAVVESQNSKLLTGDKIEAQCFVWHHPLFVANVWREGKALGQFTAGRISGLSSIKRL